MNKTRRQILLVVIISVFVFVGIGLFALSLHKAHAADIEIVPNETNADKIKKYNGDYELNDFVRLFINISRIIFGLSGSVALLMFVFGGVMFIISGGNESRVEFAKKILVAAVIGLLLIFGSYMIIQFTLRGLGIVDDGGVFKEFTGNKWFELKS